MARHPRQQRRHHAHPGPHAPVDFRRCTRHPRRQNVRQHTRRPTALGTVVAAHRRVGRIDSATEAERPESAAALRVRAEFLDDCVPPAAAANGFLGGLEEDLNGGRPRPGELRSRGPTLFENLGTPQRTPWQGKIDHGSGISHQFGPDSARSFPPCPATQDHRAEVRKCPPYVPEREAPAVPLWCVFHSIRRRIIPTQVRVLSTEVSGTQQTARLCRAGVPD